MSDRLYRSRTDRMLAGVAGGLAELWGADPSLVRIAWALLVFLTGGVALVVYIVMAIVVPEGDPAPWPSAGIGAAGTGPSGTSAPAAGDSWTPPPSRERVSSPRGGGAVPALFGAFLILLGAFFLAREFLPQIDFDWFWPAVLIALGVVLVASALRRDRSDRGGAS